MKKKCNGTEKNKATQFFFNTYSENWGDYYGDSVETLSHLDLQARLGIATEMLLRECNKKKSFSLLDIGCGTGDGTSMLPCEKASVFAMDFSKKMACKAVQRYPYLRSSAGDAVNIPFRAKSFDILLSLGTLEYIYEYRKAMFEMHRVLKKDGYLVFSIPNGDSLFRNIHKAERSLTLPIRRLRAHLQGLSEEDAGVVQIYNHLCWSLSEMKQLLKETGFTCLDYKLITYGWLLPRAEGWKINRKFCNWMNSHINSKGGIARNLACTMVLCARAV